MKIRAKIGVKKNMKIIMKKEIMNQDKEINKKIIKKTLIRTDGLIIMKKIIIVNISQLKSI